MDTGTNSGRPVVGADDAGRAVAAWEQQDATGIWTVWASSRGADGTWSAPAQIDGTGATGTGAEPLPAIAVNASGAAVVVFEEQFPQGTGPAASNVWSVRYAPAAGWSAAAQFFAPVVGNQVVGNENPQVAIDTEGNAVAVWGQDMGDAVSTNPDFGIQIYVSRLTGQSWSSPLLLSSYVGDGFCEDPAVAVDDTGDAVATWSANPANMPIHAMASRSVGGTPMWSPGVFLDQCSTCSTALAVDSRVAMDAQGNAWAVWTQEQSGGTVGVFASHLLLSGSTWTAPSQLDSVLATNSNASFLTLGGTPTGVVQPLWLNVSAADPHTVYTARYSGTAWTESFPLDTVIPGGGTQPSISVNAAGNVIAVWNVNGTLFSSVFDATRDTWIAEIQVDAQDTTSSSPAVAILPTCPVALLVYQDQINQGAGEGIFSVVMK